MRGSSRFRAVALSACFGLLWILAPAPAAATITGPCTAELAGVPVTQGHDTAGSAIDVDYRDTVSYNGQSTSGQTVTAVEVAVEILGLGVLTNQGATEGPTWESTADVEKYAWAGVGLYRVRGKSLGEGGEILCTGVAYVCVEGKSPFTTVAGGAAAGAGAVALIMLLRGLAIRRRRSRGRMAVRFGGAGLLGGIAAAVLLQHTCTLPLEQALTGEIVGGALAGGLLIGALIGRGAAPAKRRGEREPVVYRFAPGPDACNACRSHAAHRTYRAAEAIEADRAHPGCNCQIVSEPRQQVELVTLFVGRGNVHDDREP